MNRSAIDDLKPVGGRRSTEGVALAGVDDRQLAGDKQPCTLAFMALAPWVEKTNSLATGQVSTGPGAPHYDLFPPLVHGCPQTSTADIQYPIRIRYSDPIPRSAFEPPAQDGLTRWQQLLPPLAPGLSLGEGHTPLLLDPGLADWAGYEGELFIKNESINPTGSHKDRLNVCVSSAALAVNAPGILVASSGNHAISSAAYAARAGLPCIVVLSDSAADNVAHWVSGYGAVAVKVPREARWPLLRRLQHETGFMPASNLTATHTGNPFGPEGYKTISYEIRTQLRGRVPGSIFVPTGYGEMLFGIYLGFQEMLDASVITTMPRLYSCEPAVRGPLAAAISQNLPAATVEPAATRATGIACTTGGYRGVVAITASEGIASLVSDQDMAAANDELAKRGLWQEFSCGAGLAALRNQAETLPPGPAVCIVASTAIKTVDATSQHSVPVINGSWESLQTVLQARL